MKTGIILGSVRKVRLGERVAKWALKKALAQTGAEAEILDLKEHPLPFYQEIDSPNNLKGIYESAAGKNWVEKVNQFDSFILIAPEYNHGYSAVLKNAIDYMYKEIDTKPIAIISYSSGLIAGARMAEQLKNVVATLGAIVIPEVIHIGKAQEAISEDGSVLSGPFDASIEKQLSSLQSWADILNKKRGV